MPMPSGLAYLSNKDIEAASLLRGSTFPISVSEMLGTCPPPRFNLEARR